ncbi:inhibitor of apoptosis repeat-containing protein [Fistulina hepatica ATCC 64428]|uniref:Inhibitor of apoptosis repeat-containing protein n=1 Tax=Fistulina hepatica ATCC 64428 TaxID=1128425 RepID=A0A0D7A3I9_9AGAR|nr:inhibitor of apoptosis repeat-containing protein [Fistulina hepatica ATCC 64428]
MEVYQKRLESFAKPKRIKPAKGRAVSISWPHDNADYKATPESLAEAGFFYKPELGFPDNVQCYLCKRELSEWEPDDDPLEIHYQKCEHCPWAVLRCGLLHDTDSHQRFVFPDKSRIPSSPFLEQMRYETFQAGKGWPYDEEGDAHRCHSRRVRCTRSLLFSLP